MENEQYAEHDETYVIEFDGYIGYTSSLDTLRDVIRDCDVRMITIRATGEILYDARDE